MRVVSCLAQVDELCDTLPLTVRCFILILGRSMFGQVEKMRPPLFPGAEPLLAYNGHGLGEIL